MKTINLTEEEKQDAVKCIEEGKPLPEKYRFLFFEDKKEVELIRNGKTSEDKSKFIQEILIWLKKENNDSKTIDLGKGFQLVLKKTKTKVKTSIKKKIKVRHTYKIPVFIRYIIRLSIWLIILIIRYISLAVKYLKQKINKEDNE